LVKNEAVIRLRQKSSLLKVEDSIELCLGLLDNGRQVAISCEFLATMDAIQEGLQKKKIGYARVDGRSTKNTDQRETERLRYQRGEVQVMLFNVTEGISLHEGRSIMAATMYPVAKSTMICAGPRSRRIKSTGADIATGNSLRSIGLLPRRRLTDESLKFF
jgi:hypothetical protein